MLGQKRLAFEQFALVAQALANAHRLELLDIVAQGARSVERLAQLSGLTVNNTSQHLQKLRRAGLLVSRKTGTQVIYSLADREVIMLVRTLWHVTERNVAEIESIVQRYYRCRDSLEPVSRDDLIARLREASVFVVDVRPADEFAAGHVPGAVSIPISELRRRLKEIPKGREIVACCRGPYCIYSYEAIEILRPLGFDVRRLQGGYFEWLAAGCPAEPANGHPHDDIRSARQNAVI